MKKFLALSLVILFCASYISQKRKLFPKMETKSIDDKQINLPKDIAGKYTIIGLAYSKKAEVSLNTWYGPLYMQLLYKSEKPGLFASDPYDINMYFIPMFSGVNQAAAGAFKKKIKKQVDKKWQDRILIFKGKVKEYTETLGLKEKNKAYIYLLDDKGTIVYHTSGNYTEEAIVKIENILDEVE